MIWAVISSYSAGVVELLPMTRHILWSGSCFLTICQDENSSVHAARSVQSWSEDHEDALQHLLWPAHSSDLSVIEPLWSVLQSRVRSRFLPPSPLKQPEDASTIWKLHACPLLLVHILPVAVVMFLYHFLWAPHKILSQKHVIYWRISVSSQTEFIKYMPTFVRGHCCPLENTTLLSYTSCTASATLRTTTRTEYQICMMVNNCSWISDISRKRGPHSCNVLFIHISHYKIVEWTRWHITVTTRGESTQRAMDASFSRMSQKPVILRYPVAEICTASRFRS